MRKSTLNTIKSGQKVINLSESHLNEIVLELDNAAEIIINQKNEIQALENALCVNKDEIEVLQENERQMKKEKKKLIMENQKVSTTLQNEIETLKMELQHARNQVEIWKGRTNESKASLRKFLESAIMETGSDSTIGGGAGGCLESYENTIMTLKNQLDERQLRIEQLEMNIQSIDIERTDMSNELSSLKAKSKASEYELRELRERYRKEENEKKRLRMREEKLSQEIDSLCKKYNSEIDDLQKKNIELNEEIWELNREIKNNKMNIKELEDQNNKNKKCYEYYTSLKKVEEYIYSKISGFESYINVQLLALNELAQKIKSKKALKKNKGIGQITSNRDNKVKRSINNIYNNNSSSENVDIVNGASNIESSASTAINSSYCSSRNNSNPPFINNGANLNSNKDINKTTQPSISIMEKIGNVERRDDIPIIDFGQSEINNKYFGVMEAMSLVSKATDEHHIIMEKIKALSHELDEIESSDYEEERKKECYLSCNNNDNNSNVGNNCSYYNYFVSNDHEKVNNVEDDACSESSVISFLSEM